MNSRKWSDYSEVGSEERAGANDGLPEMSQMFQVKNASL
jgi:hypothetical protein